MTWTSSSKLAVVAVLLLSVIQVTQAMRNEVGRAAFGRLTSQDSEDYSLTKPSWLKTVVKHGKIAADHLDKVLKPARSASNPEAANSTEKLNVTDVGNSSVELDNTTAPPQKKGLIKLPNFKWAEKAAKDMVKGLEKGYHHVVKGAQSAYNKACSASNPSATGTIAGDLSVPENSASVTPLSLGVGWSLTKGPLFINPDLSLVLGKAVASLWWLLWNLFGCPLGVFFWRCWSVGLWSYGAC